MKTEQKGIGIQPYHFRGIYGNLPLNLRDKSCGLSWTEVYFMLEAESEAWQNNIKEIKKKGLNK